MRYEDAERRYAQIEGERDYYKQLAESRAKERDAALEREKAQAAQMMNLADALEAAEAPDAEAGDMWDASQCADWIREQSPWAALAIRDLIKQAEALEDMVSNFRAQMAEPDKLCIIDAEIISDYAADLRQRAQELK